MKKTKLHFARALGFPTDHLGGMEKTRVVQGKGSMNVAVASDFDKDGHIDAMTSFGYGVTVFKGPDWKSSRQVVRFKEAYEGKRKIRSGCIHGCLLDADGDGDQDFVGSNQMVFWLECPDKPFEQDWTFRLIDDEILGSHCLITGDVDLDGKLDLIANSGRPADTPFPNSIVWLQVPQSRSPEHPGHAMFSRTKMLGRLSLPGVRRRQPDGLPDAACGAKGGEKFPGGEWFALWEQGRDAKSFGKNESFRTSNRGLQHPSRRSKRGRPRRLPASRGHGKGVLWFKAEANSIKGGRFSPDFKPIEIDPIIDRPHSLALADMDQDGDLDAATCGSLATGEAVWYENDGKGKFTRHLLGTNQGSYDLRTVDMDGDRDLDALIAGHHNANLVGLKTRWRSPRSPSRESSLPGRVRHE